MSFQTNNTAKQYKAVDIEEYNKLYATEKDLNSSSQKNDHLISVNYIPNKRKKKAERIINFLSHSNIQWNSLGELVINDKELPNTHIVDLLIVSTRYGGLSRKYPAGTKEFLIQLKKQNFPHNLISNSAWEYFSGEENENGMENV